MLVIASRTGANQRGMLRAACPATLCTVKRPLGPCWHGASRHTLREHKCRTNNGEWIEPGRSVSFAKQRAHLPASVWSTISADAMRLLLPADAAPPTTISFSCVSNWLASMFVCVLLNGVLSEIYVDGGRVYPLSDDALSAPRVRLCTNRLFV